MSAWMIETLVATTLLMVLVLTLRRPVTCLLGARVAYWLWALPVARMLLPTLPYHVASPSPLHIALNQSGLPLLLDEGVAAPVATGAAFPWLEVVIGVWFAGMIIFLIIQAVGYMRFKRLMLADATALEDDGGIHIVSSRHADGPLAFGVLRRYIVLPADFALRFDREEQDLAIAHERAHHAHGDLAANMMALVLLAVHWCNPIAWIAYRAYRADQETACDARVLAVHGRDHAHIYGRAILKAAGGRQFAPACHLTRITTLKGRLAMLSSHDISLRRINLGMGAVALILAAGLALTASGSRAVEQMASIRQKVETANFARLSDLVAQPARATMPQIADPIAVPAVPQAPAASKAVAATIQAEPMVPTVDMVAPVPPMPAIPATPPVPPVVVREDDGRIVVTHADGRVQTHRIPTQADIRRMTPHVDVRNGCEGNETVSRRETVDIEGRRTIRVRICEAAIERAANQAELSSLRAARADMAASLAERAAERAEALREIDEEMAELRAKMGRRGHH